MSDTSSDKSSPDALADEHRGWLQVLRHKLGLTGPQTLRDTLEGVLKAPDTNAAFSDAERGMLSRLLRFGGSRVDDIMVPRADITALDETEPISELLKTFIEAGVSRIPIFRETLDDPRGMIHIKDLFGWVVAEARDHAAPACASEAKPVDDQGAAAQVIVVRDGVARNRCRQFRSRQLRRNPGAGGG